MILSRLEQIWQNSDHPFYIGGSNARLSYNDIRQIPIDSLDVVNCGDVVALIGDFDPESIASLLGLLDKGAIVVPLSEETQDQHEYFLGQSYAQYVYRKNQLLEVRSAVQFHHPLLDELRAKSNPGLILFTTGTTGRPKAILHDFIPFISRYGTPRPPLRALSFLLFDHIGGLNTLFHMLFNLGVIVSLKARNVETVLNICRTHSIELLPTTPTFLRMLSLYPGLDQVFPPSVKIISYGTERMDEPTLQRLVSFLPHVDFRQTYGMSELGILRIKSLARDSLYMKVGGEGVDTKVVDNILYIRSKNRMLGYLNAESPFDDQGWYCTKDIVECLDNGYLKITGRDSDVINIAGLKFMPSEVERVCLGHPLVRYAKALGVTNPITGQYLEVQIDPLSDQFDLAEFKQYLSSKLPRYMQPSKIKIAPPTISHRMKKL